MQIFSEMQRDADIRYLERCREMRIYREMQRCRPGAEDAQQDEDGGQHVAEQQLEGDVQGVGRAVRRVDAEVVASRLHRRPDYDIY